MKTKLKRSGRRAPKTVISRCGALAVAMQALEGRALLSTASANTTWLDVEVPHPPQENLALAAVVGKKVIFESDYSNIETIYDAASRSFSKTVFAKPQNYPNSLTIGNKAIL